MFQIHSKDGAVYDHYHKRFSNVEECANMTRDVAEKALRTMPDYMAKYAPRIVEVTGNVSAPDFDDATGEIESARAALAKLMASLAARGANDDAIDAVSRAMEQLHIVDSYVAQAEDAFEVES